MTTDGRYSPRAMKGDPANDGYVLTTMNGVPVWLPPTGGSSSLTVQDENANVSTAVTQIDFQGTGVTASAGTGEVIVTIPGETLPASLIDAKGDLIVGTADNTAARKAVGSDGQVLTADAASTGGIKWATPSSGFADPTTTKGDLIVRGASATTRLPVGTNGTVLYADSTQSAGVKWASLPGADSGASRDPRWYTPSGYTRIDGFNDDTIGASWVKVDASGKSGNIVWTEKSDVISASTGLGGTADLSAELHGIVVPLSSFGGSMVDGDGFVSNYANANFPNTNWVVAGLVISDGATHGAGNQLLISRPNLTTTLERRVLTNWNTQASATNLFSNTIGCYVRVAKISGTTWRVDVSIDCVTWTPGTTFTSSFTPTHVGFAASSWGTSTKGGFAAEYLDRVSGIT